MIPIGFTVAWNRLIPSRFFIVGHNVVINFDTILITKNKVGETIFNIFKKCVKYVR